MGNRTTTIERDLAAKVIAALRRALPAGFILAGDRVPLSPPDALLSPPVEGVEWARGYVAVSPFDFQSAEEWRAGSCNVSLEFEVRAEKDGATVDVEQIEAAVEQLLFSWRFDREAFDAAFGLLDFAPSYFMPTGGESPALNRIDGTWRFSRTFTIHGIIDA